MKLYGQITKVETQDDGAIKVIGIASTGAIDDADERVLPEAMKAALPAYMRFGALREMHGLSAAGATLSAEVDENGATRIEALVVDPVAISKVRHGVYNANLIQSSGLVKLEHGQTAANALDALDVAGVGTLKTIGQSLVSTAIATVLGKLAPAAAAG